MGYKNWAKSVWIEDDGKERIGVIPELWVEEDKNIVWRPPAEEKSKAFIKNSHQVVLGNYLNSSNLKVEVK